ncbi:barstar family protein [Pseudomonas sp. NPDC099000]|uniref:barstar family protein n=1 Tax=Pseudomonas sp. NPDC099000 TaxID=3364488 RepID=UPI00383A4A51
MAPFKFIDDLSGFGFSNNFCVRIDPSIGLTDELLKALYYQLWLPGYFGFNWDALYDCLRDLEWIKHYKVVLIHEVLPAFPEQDLRIYLEVLRDSVLDWVGDTRHELEVVFSVSDKVLVEAVLNDLSDQ